MSSDTKRVGNFAFYLLAQKKEVDKDFLTKDHLKKIVDLVHGPSYVRNKGLKKVVDLMLSHEPPVSTMTDFLAWCRVHPVLINPIIRLQLSLRQKILGEEFWEALIERRAESPKMKELGYVTDITKAAVKKYEAMAVELEGKRRSEEIQDRHRSRKGSVAKIMDKARRLSERLRKNRKIDPQSDIKKPEQKRPRRSFIKPNLKVKYEENKSKAPKKFDIARTRCLYNILFSRLIVVANDVKKGSEDVATLREMGIATEYVQSQVSSDALLCVESSLREGRPFEAVLVDGFMPGSDGPAIAKKLRRLGYAGIIIGMCEDGDGIDRENFIASGANRVLRKPLDPEIVKTTLTDLTPVIGAMLESSKSRVPE